MGFVSMNWGHTQAVKVNSSAVVPSLLKKHVWTNKLYIYIYIYIYEAWSFWYYDVFFKLLTYVVITIVITVFVYINILCWFVIQQWIIIHIGSLYVFLEHLIWINFIFDQVLYTLFCLKLSLYNALYSFTYLVVF